MSLFIYLFIYFQSLSESRIYVICITTQRRQLLYPKMIKALDGSLRACVCVYMQGISSFVVQLWGVLLALSTCFMFSCLRRLLRLLCYSSVLVTQLLVCCGMFTWKMTKTVCKMTCMMAVLTQEQYMGAEYYQSSCITCTQIWTETCGAY